MEYGNRGAVDRTTLAAGSRITNVAMDFLHQSSRGNRRALAVYRLIEIRSRHQQKRRQSLRVITRIWLAALGVGALQILLDRDRDDWFGFEFYFELAIIAACCLVSLVLYE